MPYGEQGAKRSTTHEWLGYLQKSRVWEMGQERILCMADLAKMIDWAKGAIDGSFPPDKGGDQSVDYGYKG